MIHARGRLHSLDDIKRKVSDETVFRYLFPKYIKPYYMFSIRDEKLPSANVIMGQSELLIKDFGDAAQRSAESWYKYVARTEFNNNMQETLEWAYNTFSLNLRTPFSTSNSTSKIKVYTDSKTIIRIKKRDFNQRDIKFWNSFYISVEKLKSKHIYPISYYWINDIIYDVRGTLCFAYPLGVYNGVFRYKIYRPFSSIKWRTNSNKDVIQNIHFIPKSGDLLIIQTSYKDVMCMESLGNYHTVALNSESTWFSEKTWLRLKSRWKNIIYFANNDWEKKHNPGLMYAERYFEQFKVPYIYTPNGWSDISDFLRDNGPYKTKQFLRKII